jgi:hydrogenase nickel incorporation protein HypB
MQTGQHVHVGVDDVHGHSHDHSHSHEHHHHDHGEVHAHVHSHDHAHSHDESAVHTHGRTLVLEQNILAKNNRLAERNRGWFAGRNILGLNIMSSPGAGKTTLLERTLADLGSEFSFTVIEGDQATLRDGERIRKAGCRVAQINTGAGCHLDAESVSVALRQLGPPLDSILLIENVGNLVCPALFDLGESARILVSSVTEGDDKPHKYPHMFRQADIILLNKVDLLPHVDFSAERFGAFARELNPDVRIFSVSATRGTGLEQWYGWMRDLRTKCAR